MQDRRPAYLATFPTGFEPVIAAALAKKGDKVGDVGVDAGVAVFSSSYKINELRPQFRFFTSVHHLLFRVDKPAPSFAAAIDAVDALLASRRADVAAVARALKKSSFRVCFSDEGQPPKVSLEDKKRLEKKLQAATGFIPNIRQFDVELWIMRRRDGAVFASLRPAASRAHEERRAGRLTEAVAAALCAMSSPRAGDVVLDPFAGYGGLLLARAKVAPYARLLACERDRDVFRELKKATAGLARVELTEADFLGAAAAWPPVDVVITDPPWGEHASLADAPAFYARMIERCAEVLKPRGRLALLIGGAHQADVAAGVAARFGAVTSLSVLVSGQRCTALSGVRER